MTRAGRLTMLLVGAMTGPLAAQTGGDPGIAIVRNAARVYQSLTSFQADFQLHTEDSRLGNSDGKGTLAQQGKDHFAMRFSDPPHDLVVIDGTYMWVYTPSSNPGQALRMAMPTSPVYSTNLLGFFLDNPIERYRITFVRTEQVDHLLTDVVQLEPVTKELPFRRATIWIARQDGLPRRIDTEEPDGIKRSLELSDVRTNRAVPPDMFVFHKPGGVRVIAQ
jgi:outer membrane lipoprotein-sorting protein